MLPMAPTAIEALRNSRRESGLMGPFDGRRRDSWNRSPVLRSAAWAIVTGSKLSVSLEDV